MASIEVFSRRGCHLCEVLIEELLTLVAGRVEVVVHDIDSRPGWAERYDTRVPVVEYQGEVLCEYRLDPERLNQLLRQLPRKR